MKKSYILGDFYALLKSEREKKEKEIIDLSKKKRKCICVFFAVINFPKNLKLFEKSENKLWAMEIICIKKSKYYSNKFTQFYGEFISIIEIN